MHNKLVSDVMHEGIITCPVDTPIPEVAGIMTRDDISAIVVVDDDDSLAGLISRTDLVTLYGYQDMWPHMQAEHVMVTNILTVSPSERAVVAAQRLHQEKISRLIVTLPNSKPGSEKPIGVLSITDIVRDMTFSS
jgi:CBS domain-containing protein